LAGFLVLFVATVVSHVDSFSEFYDVHNVVKLYVRHFEGTLYSYPLLEE